MEFKVPQGSSNVCEIKLEPVVPSNGKAVEWAMTDVTSKPPQAVDTLDIVFPIQSSPSVRPLEQMILVFNIAASSNAGGFNWRFFGDGILYCDGKEDYLERITPSITNNGKTLILTIKCLSNESEDFAFSFLAMRQDKTSGECQVFASADPLGAVGRQ